MIKEYPEEAEKEWTDDYEENLECGGLGAFLVTTSICKPQSPTLVDVRKKKKMNLLKNHWKIQGIT